MEKEIDIKIYTLGHVSHRSNLVRGSGRDIRSTCQRMDLEGVILKVSRFLKVCTYTNAYQNYNSSEEIRTNRAKLDRIH